jgi:hypothetical protein
MLKYLLAFGLLSSLVFDSAVADEPRATPLPQPAQVTVHNYGEQNPECNEWTNGCQICRKGEAGQVACSTPGFACQPGGVTCRAKKKAD